MPCRWLAVPCAGADLVGKEKQRAGAGPPPLALLQRLQQFAAITLPPGSGGSPPLAVLVSKMLGALATCESFAVQMNPIRALPGGYDYYGRGGGLAREWDATIEQGFQAERKGTLEVKNPGPHWGLVPAAAAGVPWCLGVGLAAAALTGARLPGAPLQAPPAGPAAAWRPAWRR